MFDTRHTDMKPTASSLRVVGIKATPAGRAHIILRGTCRRRDLDAAERTRMTVAEAAPEIEARQGSPEIDGGAAIESESRLCYTHVLWPKTGRTSSSTTAVSGWRLLTTR